MAPDGIVEAVDVAPDRVLGFSPALRDGALDPLGLPGLKEGLDNGVDAPIKVKGPIERPGAISVGHTGSRISLVPRSV